MSKGYDGQSNHERAKYLRAYQEPRYRRKSGLHIYEDEFAVRQWLSSRPLGSCVDLGCGNGLSSLLLRDIGAQRVTLCDFIGRDYLDPAVQDAITAGWADYHEDSLWQIDPLKLGPYDFLVCTDVMEHIPEDKVDAVLDNAAALVADGGSAYMRIALWGSSTDAQRKKAQEKYGGELHVTVKPHEWWQEKLDRRFKGAKDYTVWTNPRKRERSVLIAFCEKTASPKK
jgi:SAM-dependent methyltransferase